MVRKTTKPKVQPTNIAEIAVKETIPKKKFISLKDRAKSLVAHGLNTKEVARALDITKYQASILIKG